LPLLAAPTNEGADCGGCDVVACGNGADCCSVGGAMHAPIAHVSAMKLTNNLLPISASIQNRVYRCVGDCDILSSVTPSNRGSASNISINSFHGTAQSGCSISAYSYPLFVAR
jgi:hypothetical protein